MSITCRRAVLGLIVPILLLLWWEMQARGGGERSLVFAPLDQVWAALIDQAKSGYLLRDTIATTSRAITGLFLGGIAGVALGILMAMSTAADRLFNPLYNALRQVPLIGWLPLIGLWLGNGAEAKLLIVSLAAFYPMVLNSYEGVAQAERRHLEVGRIFGLNAVQRFRFILLPSALPFILTGISQALAFSWLATIGTEILLGSGAGLGVTMALAQVQQRMDIILAIILVIAGVGYLLNRLFAELRGAATRWQQP